MFTLNKILKHIAIIVCLCTIDSVFAQEYLMQLPHQEKVYLHFDQSGYYLKECMWYKAYILDESNKRTDISKVLYVELVSPEGSVIKTNKHQIECGMCDGCFYLDSAYLSGYFEVRAYTRHMRNFGEDNYFTKVFPIYDQADNGKYHYKTLLERKRDERLLRRWENRMSYKKEKEDSIGMKVVTVENNVETYNHKFKPHLITCIHSPKEIQPAGKISLTFESVPNSTFSLSITDLKTRIKPMVSYDIVKNLYNDKSWVKRTWYALREHPRSNLVYYYPEKGITVDGILIKRNFWRKKKPFQGVNVSLNLLADTLIYKGKTMSDERGHWSFELDSLYGDFSAALSVMALDDDAQLSVHKWFSPEARRYNDKEVDYENTEDLILEEIGDEEILDTDVTLNEVQIKASKESFFSYAHVSLVRFPFVELMERIWDDGYKDMYGVRDIGDYLFSYLGYPPGCARGIYVERYSNDTDIPMMMQNSPILDFNLEISNGIKEIIVRVDSLACLFYDYKPPIHIMRKFGMTQKSEETVRRYYRKYLTNDKSILYRWNYNNGDTEHIRYVVCFIKESSNDNDRSLNNDYKNSSSKRMTYVRGYTISRRFFHPDYSHSTKGLSNDFRRTLYWNPTVRTDSTGIAKVEFYNNSTCRELHISAEGIGGDMRPILYKSE